MDDKRWEPRQIQIPCQITGRRWEAKVFFVGFTFCLQREVSQSACFKIYLTHMLYILSMLV